MFNLVFVFPITFEHNEVYIKMNNIFRKLIFSCFFCTSILSCGKQEIVFPYNECINGTIIGYEECGEGSLVQVDLSQIGSTLVYHDKSLGDTTYTNVIKCPGIFPKGLIYFKAREYNSEKDHDLFLGADPKPCQMIFGPYNVPIVVITEYSQIKCP